MQGSAKIIPADNRDGSRIFLSCVADQLVPIIESKLTVGVNHDDAHEYRNRLGSHDCENWHSGANYRVGNVQWQLVAYGLNGPGSKQVTSRIYQSF